MNCFKLSLGLSLLILIFLVHNQYYLINVLLCGLIIVLLLNQIVHYEKFQSSINAASLFNAATNNSLDSEQQKQEIMITNLENKLNQLRRNSMERQEQTESEGGILIKNSCNVEAEPQEENVSSGNIPVTDALNVNGAQFSQI